MTPSVAPQDLTRTTLAVLVLGLLIAAAFWILRPFLSSFVWAAIIVVATWPVMIRLQDRLFGSRRLAVLVMTGLLLLVLVVPLAWAVSTIYGNVLRIGEWARVLETLTVPPPPAWVTRLPLVGVRIAEAWAPLTAAGEGALAARVAPYLPRLAQWFVEEAGSAGLLFVNFLLTVVIAAMLYTHGEVAGGGIRRFAHRLAGSDGEAATVLAAGAVRGVALGVVVTALVQSVLAGLGLLVAAVPAAGLLTAVTFLLCLAQLPPLLVLLPAVAWLSWTGHGVAATLLLVWSVPVSTLDTVLRPALIRKGADLPLVLIFAGAMGGLISLGITGIFIGPTVLAVGYTLLQAWTDRADDATAASPRV
jgi:predicted PurR-regulated permease PerM